jgi:hypothetical protein
MPWILIALRNIAPSAEDARHDEYRFSVDPEEAHTPFLFEQSIGGGHAERGGAAALGLGALAQHPGDWRRHLRLAGCGWTVAVLEQALARGDTTAEAAAALLAARADAELWLARPFFEVDSQRAPFTASPANADARFGFRCERCSAWVRVLLHPLLTDGNAWWLGLSDAERARVLGPFGCRAEHGLDGSARLHALDGGEARVAEVACPDCAHRYVVCISVLARSEQAWELRLQGIAERVPVPTASQAVALPALATLPVAPSPPDSACNDHAPETEDDDTATQGWYAAPDEPPLYFVSTATRIPDVARDIATLCAGMFAARDADGAQDANALVFVSNATQGKLHVEWHSRNRGEPRGDWRYTLVLRAAAGTLEDSERFERLCRRAVGRYAREAMPPALWALYRNEYDRYPRPVAPTPRVRKG